MPSARFLLLFWAALLAAVAVVAFAVVRLALWAVS